MRKILVSGYLGGEPKEHVKDGIKSHTVSMGNTEDQETVWFTLYLATRFSGVIPYLKKGGHVLVSGKPVTKIYEGKVNTMILVQELEMLSKKAEEGVPF